jgi:hypothetical protein
MGEPYLAVSSSASGVRQTFGPGFRFRRVPATIVLVIETDLPVAVDNGYKVMVGWRVGHAPEDTTTKSGLLVPIGTKDGNDALALLDVETGQRFWAVPTGAWRFIWPPSGKPVIAVRESQIIAEEELEHVGDEGQYL